jgi:microcystin-dependent protein
MTLRGLFLLVLVSMLAMMFSVPASAQQPFLGEIRFVGFNFAPVGWALCEGQTMPISENVALFSLLGTTYGGDGKTTFALPDMRGRVPVGTGQGTGLTLRNPGDKGGQESVTLTVAEMPAHRHAVIASSSAADSKAPAGNALANSSTEAIYSNQAPNVALESKSISSVGNSKPHENMQPFLGMTCIIALQGIFPARS